MSTRATERFAHEVTSPGPAQGMTFTGLRRSGGDVRGRDIPLVVALHGGGYTSAYFDVPRYSLLDRAAGLGVPIIAIDRPGHGGTTPASFGDSPSRANAAVISHLIAELSTTEEATAGIVLVGHSIGAFVALAIAATAPQWPLVGLSLSGCVPCGRPTGSPSPGTRQRHF